MGRASGKTVLITGASSGIGEACARRLASEGADLVLWARREARLHELASHLTREYEVDVRTAVLDVRERDLVLEEADVLAADGVVPHVLINNAGLARGLSKLHEGDFDDWDEMIDTNIKGLLNVSRAVIPHMARLNRGHIINIGSTAGHLTYPNGNVYAGTKFFVRGLSDGMNLDLAGTNLKVSLVDPGYIETEFSVVRFRGDEERAGRVYQGFKALTGDDVADTIAYLVGLPEYMNITDVMLMPTAQRNVYVVDRNQN